MHALILFAFGAVAFYHFAVGIPAILSVKITRKIALKLYRLHLPENLDPRYEYSLKAVGFYALTIFLICLWPFYETNPVFDSFLLRVLAFLLAIRATGRWIYRDLANKAFGIPWERSRLNVIFNVTVATLMLLLSFWQEKSLASIGF